MASMEMIKAMLKYFSQIYEKQITEDIVKTYHHTLKKYLDEQVRLASYKCLDELSYFPKPADISKRVIAKTQENNTEVRYGIVCSQCGTTGPAIKDPNTKQYLCRECFSGLSKEDFINKIENMINNIGKKVLK